MSTMWEHSWEHSEGLLGLISFVALESEVGNFASQIVANINQYVLAGERAHPRGGADRKTVFLNFMARIGGTPVH